VDTKALAHLWLLDPSVAFLNHGSYGACPRPVLEAQQRLRHEMEREPVLFLGRELESRVDEARTALGAFIGADPEDLAFVPNATAGTNSVLRSLSFAPDDEILVTDHAYNACRTAVEYVAGRARARVIVAQVPFPIGDPGEVVAAVFAAVTDRTRLAVLDHVTSPTGVVFPIDRLVAALAERGVDTLVDGAHAPGMVELDLKRLDAAYYAGNGHKWLCAPKGCGFLHVRRDRQAAIRPLAISHGANSPRTDRSRFLLEFDWAGTHDPTPYLCVPDALRCMGSLLPGGWPAVRTANRQLALEARHILCAAVGMVAPAPESMVGALATVPLPDGEGGPGGRSNNPLQRRLFDDDRIEVPVFTWPTAPKRLIRVSAQLYNRVDQYEALGRALAKALH
jgi:isopenicillin-N epimerase